MWFWSVSWSTNCPVYFSLVLVDQKKNLFSLREFLVSLWIFFGQALIFWYTKKKFWYTKKKLGGPKKIRAWPKIPWDWTIFFCQPKKMRKRPDNSSTKRLTKTTWTGLIYQLESKTEILFHTFYTFITTIITLFLSIVDKMFWYTWASAIFEAILTPTNFVTVFKNKLLSQFYCPGLFQPYLVNI